MIHLFLSRKPEGAWIPSIFDDLLVGGFNPLEKYSSNWKSSPNRGDNKKYLKPPPSHLAHFPPLFPLFFYPPTSWVRYRWAEKTVDPGEVSPTPPNFSAPFPSWSRDEMASSKIPGKDTKTEETQQKQNTYCYFFTWFFDPYPMQPYILPKRTNKNNMSTSVVYFLESGIFQLQNINR